MDQYILSLDQGTTSSRAITATSPGRGFSAAAPKAGASSNPTSAITASSSETRDVGILLLIMLVAPCGRERPGGASKGARVVGSVAAWAVSATSRRAGATAGLSEAVQELKLTWAQEPPLVRFRFA